MGVESELTASHGRSSETQGENANGLLSVKAAFDQGSAFLAAPGADATTGPRIVRQTFSRPGRPSGESEPVFRLTRTSVAIPDLVLLIEQGLRGRASIGVSR